jgi:hypothetical protein
MFMQYKFNSSYMQNILIIVEMGVRHNLGMLLQADKNLEKRV